MSDLTYAGDGRWLPGIPADDLSADDLKAIAEKRGKTPHQLTKELTDSGLYRESKPEKEKK